MNWTEFFHAKDQELEKLGFVRSFFKTFEDHLVTLEHMPDLFEMTYELLEPHIMVHFAKLIEDKLESLICNHNDHSEYNCSADPRFDRTSKKLFLDIDFPHLGRKKTILLRDEHFSILESSNDEVGAFVADVVEKADSAADDTYRQPIERDSADRQARNVSDETPPIRGSSDPDQREEKAVRTLEELLQDLWDVDNVPGSRMRDMKWVTENIPDLYAELMSSEHANIQRQQLLRVYIEFDTVTEETLERIESCIWTGFCERVEQSFTWRSFLM